MSQTVYFLVMFAGLQVLHLHPLCSKGGFIPATPQLSPPVPLLVVEGIRPDPGKFVVNPDPAILEALDENPNEVVYIGKVEMPNRSGPEVGVGVEKSFPEPEPEEDTLGL
jgi:hypothetical protein